MCHPKKALPPPPPRRGGTKSAEELGLPTGEAVIRNGKVTRLPPGHQLDEQPARATDVGPAPMPQYNPPANTQINHKTSAKDRAEGFNISTKNLSWAFAIVGALIAVWGYKAPIFSMATLFFAFAAYASAWILAWFIYQFISPDGATILHAFLSYFLVRKSMNDAKDERRAERAARYRLVQNHQLPDKQRRAYHA